MKHLFNPRDFGAVGDGATLDTKAIQQAINAAGEVKGKVILTEGIYLTGSLFLESYMEFCLSREAVLLGSNDETCYPLISTRVAGIEMDWPGAIVNIYGKRNVILSGEGTICGQGEFWWNKYWGQDGHGGMRQEYDKRNLRWVVDYDCTRPCNLLVYQSKDIALQEFTSMKSGFWNIHVCYSENIHLKGLEIKENTGPSTDGIDIDSCKNVLVEECRLDCNDDNICIKAGRDWDGLRVNRPCEKVEIRNCQIYKGAGITLGSETSGGIRDVYIHDIHFNGTDCGFRIKSAMNRGGTLADIIVEDLQMANVTYLFNWNLNWHPAYSYCALPAGEENNLPAHWEKLLKKVPEELGIPTVRNIKVSRVKGNGTRAFDIIGYQQKPIKDISFADMELEVMQFGRIEAVEGIVLKDTKISVRGENDSTEDSYDVR